MSSLAVIVEEEQRETLKKTFVIFVLISGLLQRDCIHSATSDLTSAAAAVEAFCNGGRKQRQLISFSCFIELASKPESNNG